TIGRLRIHDVAPTGRALVSRDVWRLRTIVGRTDGTDVDRSLTPFSLVSDIAPDGSSLLMTEFGDVDEVNGIYITPTDGGQRLRLGPGWPKARSRDGDRVFAVDFNRITTGPPRAAILSVRGGDPSPVSFDPI